jgi:hypothetical protein
MGRFDALARLLPAERTTNGLTRVSQSLVDDWLTCRHLFYAERVAPIAAGTGLRSIVDDEPLWVGKVFASGLAGYRRSGWRDGNWDEGAGLRALAEAADAERESAGFTDEWERRTAAAQQLLERYIDRCGPQDWGLFHIAELDGEPLIERELEVPIAEGLAYSSRPDAVVWRLADGRLCALDDKTTSRPDTARITFRRRGQLTGQQWAVQTALNNGAAAGMLVNLVHKKPGRSAPPRTLESVDRESKRLELWVTHTLETLQDINNALERYWERCLKWPEDIAARMSFSDEPAEGSCFRYNRPCRYLRACEGGESVLKWYADESRARYAQENGDAER